MSKASKKMLRQQKLIAQIKQEHGTKGVWLNAESYADLKRNITILASCRKKKHV